jgi:hypothetical protein
MPYSHSLADRIRQVFAQRRGVAEKKMFGSACFFLNGNLCVGVWHNSLIARLGPDRAAAALDQPHVGEFDVTGRPMNGWVMIEPEGIETDEQLREWIDQSVEFVSTLPKK